MLGFWRTSASLCATTASASSSSHCSKPHASSWLQDAWPTNCENRPLMKDASQETSTTTSQQGGGRNNDPHTKTKRRDRRPGRHSYRRRLFPVRSGTGDGNLIPYGARLLSNHPEHPDDRSGRRDRGAGTAGPHHGAQLRPSALARSPAPD